MGWDLETALFENHKNIIVFFFSKKNIIDFKAQENIVEQIIMGKCLIFLILLYDVNMIKTNIISTNNFDTRT